jgi:hypothetical protein
MQRTYKAELSYKLSKNGSGYGWLWELLSSDSKVLVRGEADTNLQARAHAIAEALKQISPRQQPSRDLPAP